MALIVLAIVSVDLVLSVPFIITGIIKGDTAFVKDEYTQPDTNVSSKMSKCLHHIWCHNVGTRSNAKLHCSCLW